MHRVVDPVARLADDLGRVGEVGRRLALALARLDAPEQELDRLVEELDRLEDVVDEAELERLRGADQAVLLQGVVHDQPDGRLGTDEPRRQLRPAPGGEEPEEDLGEAEVADVRGEVRTSQWSAISSPPPRAAPLTAASVGNGSSRSRPNSSWPALPPSRARSGVIPGNCVMSAPAAKTSGLPVRTRPRQSPRAQLRRATSESDASASAPKVSASASRRRCRS